MDAEVLKSMARWPGVPEVYGWLSLSRRGQWLVKGERVGHAGLADFISRNYGADARGRWYFQNGPQRVYVALEAAPLVLHTDGSGQLRTHTGARFDHPRAAFLDEQGNLYLDSPEGCGAVRDDDLSRVLEGLVSPRDPAYNWDALLQWWESAPAGVPPPGTGLRLHLGDTDLPLHRIDASRLAQRCGFDPAPQPAPGQPDC